MGARTTWLPGGTRTVYCPPHPTGTGDQGVARGGTPTSPRTAHGHTQRTREKREKRTIIIRVPCFSPYCVRLSVVSARSLADPLSFLSGM